MSSVTFPLAFEVQNDLEVVTFKKKKAPKFVFLLLLHFVLKNGQYNVLGVNHVDY